MAAPEPLTAAELEQRLRRHEDVDDDKLDLTRPLYGSMRTWTDDQSREVLEAAERCTSVRDLRVEVNELEGRAAVLVPLVLRRLTKVDVVRVYSLEDNAGEPSGVDNVLRGIIKSPSKVSNLGLIRCISSPEAFLEFCTCNCGSLEKILLDVRGTTASGPAFPAFASSVAVSWGRLASLRSFIFLFDSPHPSIPNLLATLHISSTVKTLSVDVDAETSEILNCLSLFCCCTDSLERVKVRSHLAVNMYDFFDVGYSQPFSATMRDVQFLNCAFREDAGGTLMPRAAIALRNVESLSFGGCYFASAFDLLERLPRLKTLSIVHRRRYNVLMDKVVADDESFVDDDGEEEGEDEENVADSERLIADNEGLQRLCQLTKRQESALVDMELDLVGRGPDGPENDDPFTSYPAIDDLLQCCKGRLVLNCVKLPWESHQHILGGVERLSPTLNDLSLRFHRCVMEDNDCAKIIRALCSNRTLTDLEIGVGEQVILESSVTAIHELVNTDTSLQVLSLPGLGLGAPAVLDRIIPALTDTNRSLRILKLRKANMTNRWPEIRGPMAAMLQVNHVLSAIEGCDLPPDDQVASQVRELLKLNWYGRRFWTADDLPSRMIWAKVLERISNDNDHQMMYKFLRAKPAGERSRVGLKRMRPVDDAGPA